MKVKELMAKFAKENPEEEILKLSEDDWCYDIISVFKTRIDEHGHRTDDSNGTLILVLN